MTRPITIFYVYADADEILRKRLEKHLALLRRQKVITGWQEILAGSHWAEEMERVFNEATLILLLVSADFLDSQVCYEQQMQRALERERRGEVKVVPILLRPVDWKRAPFAHLQVLPTNGNPITSWSDPDAAFAQVAERIRSLLEEQPLSEFQEKKEAHNHLPTKLSPSDTRIINSRALSVIGLVLLLIGVSIFGFFSFNFFSFKKNSIPSLSPTLTNHSVSSPILGSSTSYAYDFEGDSTQGWDTTEGSQKLAELHIVTDPVNPSNHVLEVKTKLSGSQDQEIDRHTEAKVYFSQVRPNGFVSVPPYNLLGKQVSCQVYLPPALAADRSLLPIIRMFVKDHNQRNDFEKPIEINASIVGRWYEVSLKIGEYPEDEDQQFDGTSILAIGIRIDVTPKSSLDYTGPFYIDKCIIPRY